MTAVWQHGYVATTTRMLEEATGIWIRGLFNDVGNKEQLFRIVLARYFGNVRAVLGHVFAVPGGTALDAVFAGFPEAEPPDALSHADCLMVNTVYELKRADTEVRTQVNAYRAVWKAQFMAAPEADGASQAKTRAEFLVGALWGALGQIKLAGDKAAVIPMAKVVRATPNTW